MAELLAQKRYYTLLVNELIHEKSATDQYIKIYSEATHDQAQELLEKPGYRDLLVPHFKPVQQQINEWANAGYERNMKYPNQLSHKTGSGNVVRSKSEALIDMALYTNKIPFRYECALILGDVTLYPDFTILHPETGEIYYWEHFGRMDDPDYARNTYSKLHYYSIYGIIPTINLITTYETKKNPLNSDQILKLIKEYFL